VKIVDETQPHSSTEPISKSDAIKLAEIIEKQVEDEDSSDDEAGKLTKEEEDEANIKVDFNTVKSAWKYLGGAKVMAVGMVINSGISGLRIARKYTDRFWATGSGDVPSSEDPDASKPSVATDLIWWNLQISLAIFVIDIVLEKLKEKMNRQIADDTKSRFFELVFDKIIHAPIPSYFDVTPTSRIMRHFHHDLNAIDMWTLHLIFDFYVHIQLIGFAAYQIMFNVPILAIIIPLHVLRGFRFDQQNRKVDEKRHKVNRVFHERLDKINRANFEGAKLMRAYGNQHLIVKDYNHVSM